MNLTVLLYNSLIDLSEDLIFVMVCKTKVINEDVFCWVGGKDWFCLIKKPHEIEILQRDECFPF